MHVVDEINIDYACRALLGGGKGKSVMEELKKVNQPYYDQIMSLARERLRKEGVVEDTNLKKLKETKWSCATPDHCEDCRYRIECRQSSVKSEVQNGNLPNL
jgi:hypothetical protein